MICKFFIHFNNIRFLILLHLWLLFSDNIYNEEIKKDGMSVVL